MVKTIFAALLCGLMSLSCASVSFAPEAPRSIPGDLFGMAHAGFHLSAKEYRLLDDLGAVWMRRTFRWQQTQTRSKSWDFRRWDRYVNSGLRAGKKILAVLAYDVGWIHGEKEAPRRSIGPEDLAYYLQYVEGIVRRYKGRIAAYEIWNEPNWVFWKGTEEEFVLLSRAAARKIREIDPEAKIVAGSFFRVPEKFIRKMFAGGAMENVDAVSFHPYAVNPRGTLELFDRLEKILGEFGFRGEIWVTEVGYPTGGLYVTRVAERDFPDYVVKSLAGLAAKGARTIFWYELFDKFREGRAPTQSDSGLFFGLAYPDYTRKEGAAAYALVARHIAGSDYRPDLVDRRNLPSSLVTMFFRGSGEAGGGRSALIVWNEGSASVPVAVRLPGRDRLRHDIASGREEAAGETAAFSAGDRPEFFSWREDEPAGAEGRVIVEASR